MEAVVTKGRFAELSGVSAGRVSQWIAEGKIGGDALVGEGRSARIDVERARRQLKGRLDLSQRFGFNGLTTSLGADEPGSEVPAQLSLARAPSIDDRIRAERLAQEEMKTRRMAEEERLTVGLYVRSADVTREMDKLAATMVASFEGALADFATEIAGTFSLDQRAVVHALKLGFRKFRERSASNAAMQAEALPETVVDAAVS